MRPTKKSFTSWALPLSVVVIVGVIATAATDTNYRTAQPEILDASNRSQTSIRFSAASPVSQKMIISSVVNIWCPDNISNKATGGSGTIWTSKGLILTNAHIIPQDRKQNPTVSHCMVTLPNSNGGIKDIYEGEPIIIPDLSKKYDLAFIRITGPYTDSYGVDHGPFPSVFPDYPDFGCLDTVVTLSEPVTVFGYPEISDNGNSLTITTGSASALPGDGTIVTSAKVTHGDSGGLAVDENGCMIGVPSMVSADEAESLGIIKSYNEVDRFIQESQKVLDSPGSP